MSPFFHRQVRRLWRWLLALPFAALVVIFALANRDIVSVSLWPFPIAVDVPLYVLVLGVGLLTFVGGALVGWLSQAAVRGEARTLAARNRRLERDSTS